MANGTLAYGFFSKSDLKYIAVALVYLKFLTKYLYYYIRELVLIHAHIRVGLIVILDQILVLC